uniref:Uncharacterized protein n=1 Tax=Bracon brevicornis TaxID=1563983 RepID=A0A6V7JSK0_9HYME
MIGYNSSSLEGKSEPLPGREASEICLTPVHHYTSEEHENPGAFVSIESFHHEFAPTGGREHQQMTNENPFMDDIPPLPEDNNDSEFDFLNHQEILKIIHMVHCFICTPKILTRHIVIAKEVVCRSLAQTKVEV